MPAHLWQALQRFDIWVEPSLQAEWSRLIVGYGESQGRIVNTASIAKAMVWSDPERDVSMARTRALKLLSEQRLQCVWTGQDLTEANLDIDHCLPWVAWPCSDLWNLMPAHARVNRVKKRDRLPTQGVLGAARQRIVNWWEVAYLNAAGESLPERFRTEARASLPGLDASALGLDDVFSGLSLQRLRLKENQQVPEWHG